jgi:uncharacterized OsmC-like protein
MTTSAQKISEPTMINGLNVDDVLALVETVKADPDEGQTHWKVTSSWQGGTHTRSYVDSFRLGGEEYERRFIIDTDEPEQIGGGNLHPNPQEQLMAALNACMMVGYVALSALHGIRLEKVEIETEGEIDLRGFFGLDETVPPGYESLSYTVRIKGDAPKEKFAEIHEMVRATSPNFHNISKAIALNARLMVE